MSYVADLRKKVGHMPLQLPGTGVVVWRNSSNKGIEILLQLRSDHNKFGLLGGGIELGESYEQCAIRELQEEAAISASSSELLLKGVYAGQNHITIHPNGDIVYHTVVVYTLKYDNTSTASTTISSETKSLQWLSIDEIKKLLAKAEKHFFHNNIPILWDIVNKFFC